MADNKATKEEVEAFLKEFKEKSKVFDIAFRLDKEENLQFLLEFEMPPDERKKYIMNLKVEDYYQGPDTNLDDEEEGDVWMFGIGIKKKGKGKPIPIYIKIYITKTNGVPNYCISFHKEKRKMIFPYKTEL